ncbi:MAG: lmo0937 family membrane protein [Thermoanaerobaculia bacterium]
MVWTVFVILLILWLLGFFAFHIGGGLVHLLLLAAVVALVLGLVRRAP